MQPFGFTHEAGGGHAYSRGLLDDTGTTPPRGLPGRDCRTPRGTSQDSRPRAQAWRTAVQEHAAAKGTPNSSPTWRQWTSCSRPASSTPWSSTERSRPWDTTASFVSCAPTSSPDAHCDPAVPPYASRPSPPVSCSMTGGRSSSPCRRSSAQRVHIAVSVLGYSQALPRHGGALLRRRAHLRESGAGLRLVRRCHPAGMGRQPQGRGDRPCTRRRALQRTLQAVGPPLWLRAQGLPSLPPAD